MAEKRELAISALSADIDSLYAVLGLAVEPSLGANAEDLDRLAETGRKWVDNHGDDIRTVICEEGNRRNILNALNSDEVSACLTIADLILASIHGVPIYVLSALIIKISMRRFCNDIRR